MKKAWIILAIIVVIIGGMTIGSYNSLVKSREEVDRASGEIDVQLKRRYDLIGNLLETVKGYAAHETEIFKNVTDARARMTGASTTEEKAAANEEATGALGRLIAITEGYPELKADVNFRQFSDELSGTENRIAVARRDYNNAVSLYNKKVIGFPSNIFAGSMGMEKAPYFEAAEGEKEAPKVNFGS